MLHIYSGAMPVPMLLTEMFASIQGEGIFTGISMFFVRTNRCNLRCTWCDSDYTFFGGKEVPLDDILAAVADSGLDWVCLTGGEPLLQRESVELVGKLTAEGKHVLVETSGSLPVHAFTEIKDCFIDMDIKTPSSGEQDSLHEENLSALRESDYVKFVIASEKDYDFAKDQLKKIPAHVPVIFQPAWGTEMKWIAEQILKDRLKVRLMSQLHKQIWGDTPGK